MEVRLCGHPIRGVDQDFLQLKDVAAIFSDRGKRNGVPQMCRVGFDRHASTAQGMFLEDHSPIPGEVMVPGAEGGRTKCGVVGE